MITFLNGNKKLSYLYRFGIAICRYLSFRQFVPFVKILCFYIELAEMTLFTLKKWDNKCKLLMFN